MNLSFNNDINHIKLKALVCSSWYWSNNQYKSNGSQTRLDSNTTITYSLCYKRGKRQSSLRNGAGPLAKKLRKLKWARWEPENAKGKSLSKYEQSQIVNAESTKLKDLLYQPTNSKGMKVRVLSLWPTPLATCATTSYPGANCILTWKAASPQRACCLEISTEE